MPTSRRPPLPRAQGNHPSIYLECRVGLLRHPPSANPSNLHVAPPQVKKKSKFPESTLVCHFSNCQSPIRHRALIRSSAVVAKRFERRFATMALVVFLITVHTYAEEKSEMEELSLVALSGCIWLQAFVVALEMNSFTVVQHIAIWGNFAGFYAINCIVSTLPSAGMYTIMFRLCRQPSYWITMILIVALGMGPVLALKYFRYTYRSSAINILQQAERSRSPIFSMGNLESQLNSVEKDMASLSGTQPKNRNPVYEPLLSESATATRRSIGQSTFDFFQPVQSRLSSSYARNYKNN